ncbi:E3 ubiquitin-protein ligase RHA2A-like [Cucurbita pepo subsp. pepo]|uniref:E3 ubiquitin-protein ligase RHA2A-like n=1 Tax=Cucurbita pepo subsp. pepo TaxID=3664 RepID=UPI000C9DA1E0|nr:E3 ubiquitin-protein ligase RHA2A-like [Cucurbita pepo subsp. pepo]XP_023518046.1 E3 ubiquitin-protein ligase RHA2A-like [Cucurbita pepo subsp. pepo]
MSFVTSRPIQYRIYGYTSAASGEQPYQVLQLQLRYFRREISVSPLSGVTYLQETAPILLRNLLFPLRLQELHNPVFLQGWSNDNALGEETAILEEARPVTEKVEENGEEMGDCSICLEELNGNGNGNGNGEGKKREEVIRMQCGHVYHESCIFNWLHHNSSCPLCRAPL